MPCALFKCRVLFINRKRCLATDLGDDDSDTDHEATEPSFKKKAPSKKKVGRKGRWSNEALDDFIDIVANNDSYKEKLIFRNTKNQQNGIIYEKIRKEINGRCAEREEDFTFTIEQLRSKFKKCVGECKKAALTIKTASGIKRFQDDKGFGAWFNQLFALVRTRDSCQPELAVEPSADNNGRETNSSDTSGLQPKVFVPLRSKKREKNKENGDAVTEVLAVIKSALANDPVKEMINFMREEAKESREHDRQLFQMLLQNTQQMQAPQFHPNVPGTSNWQNGFMNQLNTFPHGFDGAPCQNVPFMNTSTPKQSTATGHYETETYQSL